MNNGIYWLQHLWFFWIASDKGINCKITVYSTNNMIAITSWISRVNTQHSWAQDFLKGISSREGKEEKPINQSLQFYVKFSSPHLDMRLGCILYLTNHYFAKCSEWGCSQTLHSLLLHCTEYFSMGGVLGLFKIFQGIRKDKILWFSPHSMFIVSDKSEDLHLVSMITL